MPKRIERHRYGNGMAASKAVKSGFPVRLSPPLPPPPAPAEAALRPPGRDATILYI